MLNPFYWYSFVWTFVLLLYSFNISDFCQPLNPQLLFFLIISIIISFVIGVIFKDVYNIKFDKMKEHVSIKPTIVVIVLYLLNFLYARDIPLLDSLLGKGITYKEFDGIPILGVAIMIVAEIYAVYLSIQFVRFHKVRLLIETASVIMLSVLQQSRHILLVCTIAIVVTYLKTHKLKLKNYALGMAVIILFCYVVGGLGNIRHLSSWTDSSYIESLSRINDNYPDWLPKEFIWAYIYVVTPLANLNYNVQYNFVEHSFSNLIVSFLPNFITKRTTISPLSESKLILNNFTASTAYAQTYRFGGWTGIIITQILLLSEMLLFTYIIYKKKSSRPEIARVAIIFQLYFSSLTIFAEIFTFDGTVLPMLLLMVMLICPKFKIVLGNKTIKFTKDKSKKFNNVIK